MTDEVSASMHLSIVVWMTGALISIVCGVLIMSLSLFRNYTSQYSDITTSAIQADILQTQSTKPQPGVIIYSNIQSSIGTIDAVKLNNTYIYKYNDEDLSGLHSLMTVNKNKMYRVKVTAGVFLHDLYTVYLEEVP